jgi:hypothetical protein
MVRRGSGVRVPPPAQLKRALVVALAGLAMLISAPARAGHGGKHPDSIAQPPSDGCERNPLDLISTALSPQWAFVNRDATPKYVRGTVELARPTHTDNFRQHDSYDLNWNLRPNAEYQSLLATANLRTDEAEARGTLHNEWEQRAYPLFAWPTVADDVEMIGSWIWDCGHWSDPDYADPMEDAL